MRLTTVSDVLSFLQLIALLITLYSFWRSRRKEFEARIIWEQNLNNSIRDLEKAVLRLDHAYENQVTVDRDRDEKLRNIQLLVELIIQQHKMNHGQQINGGTI